ncbi:hypothetical protein Pelo_18586 [Pelomyxa schiedti]|nr:hypothetical protein Pelo_18586 [Pelomyxa schiedti]
MSVVPITVNSQNGTTENSNNPEQRRRRLVLPPLPSPSALIGEQDSNNCTDFLIHEELVHGVGASNVKWIVHSCVGLSGFRLVRLSDRSGKRIPLSLDSVEGPSALSCDSLISFFFNKSNDDEAVVVVKGFTMVVVNLAESFSSGVARVLSETSWGSSKPNMYSSLESVLVFNNVKHAGKRFLIVLLTTDVFVREEGSSFCNQDALLCTEALGLSQLNDTMFCVSLIEEYQLRDANNPATPLRTIPIVGCVERHLVTAENGLLFHHHQTEEGTEIHVTEPSTGALVLFLTGIPPHSAVSISSFVNGKAEQKSIYTP